MRRASSRRAGGCWAMSSGGSSKSKSEVRSTRVAATGLEQPRLVAGRRDETEMGVGERRGHAAALRALEEAFHDEERLVDVLERVGLLAHHDGECRHADRAAVVLLDEGGEQAAVHLVEAARVDVEEAERALDRTGIEAAVVLHLREVAHAAEQAVG